MTCGIHYYCLCVYVLRVDHLVLDSQLDSSPLEGRILALSAVLIVAPHLEASRWGLIHVGMATGVGFVQVLFRKPCCWALVDIASLSHLENSVRQQTSWSSGFYDLSAPSSSLLPKLRCYRCVSCGWGTPRSVVLCILTSCGVQQSSPSASWWGLRGALPCGSEEKSGECVFMLGSIPL